MWVFMRVYGPTLCKEREDFWAELGDIRGLWDDPWCFGGDLMQSDLPGKEDIVTE